MNVAECLCLREGRDNFSVNPERDDTYFFGPDEWVQQIDRLLKRAMLLNQPPRIVWWGDYGIGKTHRINYAIRKIHDQNLPFYPVFAVSSDISDKSGFERLHYPLVNNLGAEELHIVVERFVLKLRPPSLNQTSFADWSELAHSDDVVKAVQNFGNANENNWRAAWKWLTGLKLNKDEVRLAQVTKDQIDSSMEYAEVLRALSLIIGHEMQKRVVFFIDQVERLQKITNANAQNTWVETLRAVLDMSEAGMVLAIGASRLDQLPAVVLSPEVASRFGKEAYEKHHLKAYTQEDAELFLKQLFAVWVDPHKRDSLAAEHEWVPPSYDPCCYPFTSEGFSVFCRNVTHDPRDAKPRAFLQKLDGVAAEACMEDTRIIDRAFLIHLGFSD